MTDEAVEFPVDIVCILNNNKLNKCTHITDDLVILQTSKHYSGVSRSGTAVNRHVDVNDLDFDTRRRSSPTRTLWTQSPPVDLGGKDQAFKGIPSLEMAVSLDLQVM